VNYFFDSYAIIEIFKNNPAYDKYKEFIILTTSLNLAEVFYSLLNELDKQSADYLINNANFEFIEITPELALESSYFRYKNKKLNLSYADCLGYIVAKTMDIPFLTGDRGFQNMENVEYIK